MSGQRARLLLPARLGIGRPAVFLSLGLHVVAFVVTLGVPRLLASSGKAGPVYVVDLVSFGGGSPGPAAPPAASPAQKASKPAPAVPAPPPKKKAPEKAIVIPEKGAKKTPPKAPQKPAPKPEPEAKPESPDAKEPETPQEASPEAQGGALEPVAGATSPGGGPAGKPGGTGAGTGQGTGFGGDAYTFYLALLDRSIKGAWRRPLYGGQEVLSATVRLEISRSGRVLKLALLSPSGNEALDRSVLKAVRDAEPFPPLPTTLSGETLPVQIVFELNPQTLGGAPGE